MPQEMHSDDHDKIIRLETNMVALVQHLDNLVDSQKDVDKNLRDLTDRIFKMLQDHSESTGHQKLVGSVDLTNQTVKQNSDEIKELKKKAEDAENVLRLVKAGAVIVLPIFTGVIVLIIKLFFHL